MDPTPDINSQELIDLNLLERSSITKRYKFSTFKQIQFDKYYNKLSVHCSDLSRNREFLVCGCRKNIIVIYDLISKDSQIVNVDNISLKKNIIISIKFAFYYDHIVAGDSEGNLLIYRIQPLINGLSASFIKIIPKLHDRPIFHIQNDSSDILFTASSRYIKVFSLSSLIMTDVVNPLEIVPLSSQVVALKLHIIPDVHSYLFLGYANGEVVQMQLTLNAQIRKLQHTNYSFNNFNKRYVSAIDVSYDMSLLAVGYTETASLFGFLTIFYTKKKNVIYQSKKEITKQKLSHLLFFKDVSHLMIGSRDGSLQILNIKSKQLLQTYYCGNLHEQGIIGLYFMQDDRQFPQILSVGQEHTITKTYFGLLKENMIDYVPFIFWVEMRIRQELDYKSELIEFLKSLYLGSIGVDIIRRQLHKTTIIGYDLFGPLLKRIVDYDEYGTKNPQLYNLLMEQKSQLKQSLKSIILDQIQPPQPPPPQYVRKPVGKLPLLTSLISQDVEIHSVNDPPLLIPPLQNSNKLFQFINDELKKASEFKNILKNKIFSDLDEQANNLEVQDVLDERVGLYTKIVNTIDVQKLQILNLSKCSFLFDDRLPFTELFYQTISNASSLKYLDASYNMLNSEQAIKLLDRIQKDLEFLSLGHNNLGEENSKKKITFSDIQKIFGKNNQVSLRANGFSDSEGEVILNAVRKFNQLKILDISGNLEFGDKTLIALQRLTVTENRINFTVRKDQKNLFQLIRNMSFLQDNKILEGEEDQDNAESIAIQSESKINQNNVIGIKQIEKKVVLNPSDNPLVMDEQTRLLQKEQKEVIEGQEFFHYQRTSSNISNQSDMDISLQLLCIQMKPERCEQAMKTATDFLVQNKIPNLYVYVVDNKIDNVWESSISVFYTRPIKKKFDHIKNCLFSLVSAVTDGFSLIFMETFNKSKECLKSIFCSTYFIYKYFMCCFCTFLTSSVGSIIVKSLGSSEHVFEFSDTYIHVENELRAKKFYLTWFFVLNYLIFYAVVITLPAIYVSGCQGVQWLGHIFYMIYFGYCLLVECLAAYYCNNFKITNNSYNTGPQYQRVLSILKDLFLSQVTKFDVYADLCFISLVHFCGFNKELAYAALAILGLNFLIEAYLVFKTIIIFSHSNSENVIYSVNNYAALTNLNMINNYLDKWSSQGTINFWIIKAIPTRVFSAILKTVLQDIPLSILQITYFSLNPQQKSIGILRVSLIVSLFHMVISIIRALTISRVSRINDTIMINEIALKTKTGVQNLTEDKKYNEEIDEFIKNYNDKQVQLNEELIDQHNQYVLELKGKQDHHMVVKINSKKASGKQMNRIVPINKKGITIFGDNLEEAEVLFDNEQKTLSLQKKLESKSSQQLSTFHAFSLTYGTQMRKYQLQNLPHQISEILLIDIQRHHFTTSTEWDKGSEIDGGTNIHSMSVTSQILCLYLPYMKRLNPLRILDIGIGSGYFTLALQKLSKKVNPEAEIQIVGLEHIQSLIFTAKQNINENGSYSQDLIEMREFDCLDSISQAFPNQKFDIINLGCSITQQKIDEDLKYLMSDDSIMFGCKLYTQESNNGFICTKFGDIYSQNESDIVKNKKYGVLTMKELQNSVEHKQMTLQTYSNCCDCGIALNKCAQFINPFWGQSLCLNCGLKDKDFKDIQLIESMNIKTNLVYWNGIDEKELGDINTKRLGTNRQPQINKPYSRRHDIKCNGCSTSLFQTGYRYICLGCIKDKYKGPNGFVDLCDQCGNAVIMDNTDLTLQDSFIKGDTKHSNNHPLLRLIFSLGYYKY